jgi:uncharacterized delta-60 repeat protein
LVAFLCAVATFVFFYGTMAHAAPGNLDTTFDGDGKAATDFVDAFNDSGLDVAVQEDGKIVVAGDVLVSETGHDFGVARYNPDGSPDTTFGSGGKVTTPVGSGTSTDSAYGVAVRPDGKIVAAGFANGGVDFAAVRYNADGSLDGSFGGDGKVTTDLGSGSDYAVDVAVVGTDTILAGRTHNGSNLDFAMVRYDDGGNLIPGFGTGGVVETDLFGGDDYGEDIAVEPGGNIAFAGSTRDPNNAAAGEDFALARYDADGKLATDFGGAGDWLWDLALQDDGGIVVAGTSGNSSGGANFGVVRYNPDGSLDTSFDHDGRTQTDFYGFSDEARSVALQEDGRIVAAGLTYDPNSGGNFALARYFGGSDASPPKVAPPTQSLPANSALGATSVPVRLSWSATDLHGDVTRYKLQQSVDGGSYNSVSLPSASSTSRTLLLAPGHNYRYRVRATDDNGNESVWKYGSRFAVDAHQETGTNIAYTGTWKSQSLTSASGGTIAYSTVSGATAELAFAGRSVTWVAPKTSNRGQAEVWLDGRKVATVDLFSATAQARRLVYAANGLDPSVTHTLQVKVLGTAGRPRVDVDAFVVLR